MFFNGLVSHMYTQYPVLKADISKWNSVYIFNECMHCRQEAVNDRLLYYMYLLNFNGKDFKSVANLKQKEMYPFLSFSQFLLVFSWRSLKNWNEKS